MEDLKVTLENESEKIVKHGETAKTVLLVGNCAVGAAGGWIIGSIVTGLVAPVDPVTKTLITVGGIAVTAAAEIAMINTFTDATNDFVDSIVAKKLRNLSQEYHVPVSEFNPEYSWVDAK